MPTVVLLQNDIWRALRRSVKPKGLVGQPLNFRVQMEVNAAARAAVKEDPLLQAKVTEAASKEYEKTMAILSERLKLADKMYLKTDSQAGRDKYLNGFRDRAKVELTKMSKSATKAAEGAWAKVAKDKAEYNKYKFKAGVDLAVDGLGVVVGVVGAVGSGGWSLVVSITTIIKTVVGMVVKLIKLRLEANRLQSHIKSQISKLQKSMKNNSQNIKNAKDFGAAFANNLLGSDFIPSLDGIGKDNEQYKSKLQGVDVASHKMAKELNRLFPRINKLMGNPVIQHSKPAKASLSQLETQTQSLIDAIVKNQDNIKAGMKWQTDVATWVKDMKAAKSKTWKALDKALPLVDIILSGGDYKSAAESLKGVGEALTTEAIKQGLNKM